MKLINFHETELAKIRKELWAPLIEYKTVSEWIPRESMILEKIDSSTVKINPEDNTITNESWEKIVIYMGNYSLESLKEFWPPKIHFLNCFKIREMINSDEFDRYVWAYTRNWLLKVKIIDRQKNEVVETREMELKICEGCLREADKQNIIPEKLLKYSNWKEFDFTLQRYFDFYEYFRNRVKSPKYNFTTIPTNTYPKNWEEISKIERQRVNYICQWCKKDFSNDKYNLHVHHKDHNKWNNFTDNFEVLCYDCHAEHHEHMKK